MEKVKFKYKRLLCKSYEIGEDLGGELTLDCKFYVVGTGVLLKGKVHLHDSLECEDIPGKYASFEPGMFCNKFCNYTYLYGISAIKAFEELIIKEDKNLYERFSKAFLVEEPYMEDYDNSELEYIIKNRQNPN